MSIEILRGDDWIGLYVDGNLVREGHRIQEEDMVRCVVGVKPETLYADDDEFWDKWAAHCPQTWDEVKETL